MGVTVGIDLGTTNSGVAVMEGRTPRMVLNDTGGNTTPSAIWQSPSGELSVGAVAYKKAGAARRFKRMMGAETPLALGSRSLAPEEASSLILRKLVEDAERTLRQTVDSAVITVPANWKDGPRRATHTAGQLAGLEVKRLINEPTAAAMAYGLRPDADGKTIAVYDLGGGTFDVTILKIHNGVFDVVTSNGDDHLGGTDFDLRLMQLVLRRLTERTGYRAPDEGAVDEKLRQRLRDLELACEEAKKELSFTGEAEIVVPFLDLHDGEPLSVEDRITRADLESLIGGDVDRTLQYMDSALRDAKVARESIDDIVLVGGSTRIPLVRQRVAEFFNKEPHTTAVNPDEAIALGAAIQAGIIGQDTVDDDAVVVLDIVNNTLGLEVVQIVGGRPVEGVFSPILAKGSKVPASATEPYSTVADNQTSVLLRCFEGESPVTEQNTLLDEIRVEGLPPRPGGETSIEVTFTKTVNDMLEVSWQVKGMDLRGSHTIAMRTGLDDPDEVRRRKGQLEEMFSRGRSAPAGGMPQTPPPPDWRAAPLAEKYRALIERAEGALAGTDGSSHAALRDALDQLKAAVAAGDATRADALDLQLTDILFDLE